jgi:hypothetical protein
MRVTRPAKRPLAQVCRRRFRHPIREWGVSACGVDDRMHLHRARVSAEKVQCIAYVKPIAACVGLTVVGSAPGQELAFPLVHAGCNGRFVQELQLPLDIASRPEHWSSCASERRTDGFADQRRLFANQIHPWSEFAL